MATDNFAKSVLNNAANSFTYLCVQVIQKRHFLAQIHINTTDINLKRNKQTDKLHCCGATLSGRNRKVSNICIPSTLQYYCHSARIS